MKLKLNKNPRITTVIGFATILCLMTVSAWGQTKEELSKKRYVDPKGYFRIVPPNGWKIQEYPQDPRGKVAFMPSEANVDLRILINAVDVTTTDELIKAFKDIEERTGLMTNIERTEFGGRQAVKRSFEAKGLKFYIIDFLLGSIDHNIQFGAPISSYQKYLPMITESIETYEAIANVASEKEILQHSVAKKLRLAQLMMDQGNYELSLDYIKEGLELSPQDAKLLELKKQVESKVGKE